MPILLGLVAHAAHVDVPATTTTQGWSSEVLSALITAFVALAGVIILFWLQQSASRRGERQAAQDRAFEELSEMFQDFLLALQSGDAEDFEAQRFRFTYRLSRAFWFIDTKDDHVSSWIVQRAELMADEMLAAPDLRARGRRGRAAFNEIILVLRRWRYEHPSAAKFKRMVARLEPRQTPSS